MFKRMESPERRVILRDAVLFVLCAAPVLYTMTAYTGSSGHSQDNLPIQLILLLGVFMPCVFAMNLLVLPYGKPAGKTRMGQAVFFAAAGFQMLLAISFAFALEKP